VSVEERLADPKISTQFACCSSVKLHLARTGRATRARIKGWFEQHLAVGQSRGHGEVLYLT
jgi:hypothetical protein